MTKLANSWVNRLSSILGGGSSDMDAGPDLSRRMVLSGAVAAVACGGLLAAGLSTPAAAAEVAMDDGEIILADHGRRRSRRFGYEGHDDFERHGRRRSRNQHSRRRSGDHGRRRSRGEFRDWNENCFLSPVGWICF